MTTKTEMRSNMLTRRDRLGADVRAKKSVEICREAQAQIAAIFERPRVALYFPMRSEVDVRPLILAAYQLDWELSFPCMVFDGENSVMQFYRIPKPVYQQALEAFLAKPLLRHHHNQLVRDGYELTPPQHVDVIIVPLVAFDDQGNRLGYGGGNYDRFLPQVRHDALVLGVAFEEQRVERVTCDHHDQPLPQIISR